MTTTETELREKLAKAEEERDGYARRCAAYEDRGEATRYVIAAAREWSVVYADGEGSEAQEPYLDKLAKTVSDLNDWAARNGGIPESFLAAAKAAPSIMDVLADPNGPAAKPLFPGLLDKGEG